MKPLFSFIFARLFLAVTFGLPALAQAQTFTTLPFSENFESGVLQSYWVKSGAGPYRGQITTANSPHGGVRHYTMDGSAQNSNERNELTLGLNLAGYTNVVLSFWVRNFSDEANGPPPTPFSTSADFDGVAISQDGVTWYEVQGLRNLANSYVQYTVNLDTAVAAFGLSYNSSFRIRFNQYDNYPIQASNSDGIGLDDISVTGSIPGTLHHFNLTAVSTPQLVNGPFPVTITAVDAVNNLVSGFGGTVSLWGVLGSNSSPSSTMMGNPSWEVGANGPVTIGYSFTPTNNITVTHIRHYSPGKVSIWTDGGVLLASQNVPGPELVWQESPLASPLGLMAGNTYRIGLYIGADQFYYYRNSAGPFAFADGTIDHRHSFPGDAFPSVNSGLDGYWPFVDIRYVPGLFTIPVSPNTTANFVNGIWTGSISVTQAVANLRLHAENVTGQAGEGNSFTVLATNDLALTASSPNSVIPIGTDLVYELRVLNAGPAAATGVIVTNILPSNAAFISFTAGQGSYSLAGSTLVWNLGTVAAKTNIAASLVVRPTIAGFLTNAATVSRSGADAVTSNNSVSLTNQAAALGVLTVTPATGLNATGMFGGPFTPTNQVYVLSNAGSATLSWSFIRGAAWVTPPAFSGSLGPGDSTSFNLRLNTTAATLQPGTYLESVTFSNLSTGLGSTTRSLRLMVATNQTPLATALALSTPKNTPLTITLSGTDADNDPLTAKVTFLPLSGRLFQTPDGFALGAPIITNNTVVSNSLRKVIYLPATNFFGNGLGDFVFTVNDGRTNSPNAAVAIDVTDVNQPPVAVPDKVSVLPGEATSPFNLLANDFDAENDPFDFDAISSPALGTLTPLGGGQFIYTPNSGVNKGAEQLTYTIRDGLNRTASAKATINIGPMVGGDWPTLGNGPQHTGYYPSSLGTNLFTPIWTNTYTGTINQVAAADGMIFLTMASGVPYFQMLAALDARTGQQLWRNDYAGGNSISAPTFDNGRVYFQRSNHENDTHLRCVDARTGAILWVAPYGAQWDWSLAPLVVGDGVWIAGGTYGGMYGFDTASGGMRFFNDYGNLVEGWSPTYHNGLIYSWYGTTFRASNPVYGTDISTVSAPGSPFYPDTMNTAAVIQGDRAVLMANTYLDCMDLNSHSVAWANPGSFRGMPAVNNNIVYCIAATSPNSQVNAYDLTSGALLGSCIATNDNGLNGQVIVTDDCLLVASTTKTYIFRLQDYQLIQTLPFGGNISLADGNLYLAAYTYVRAYGIATPTQSDDVSIAFSALPTNTVALQSLTYTLTITNPGPDAATGLVVTNFLTPGVVITNAIASQGTCTNYTNGLSAALGTLAAGTSATVTVTIVPNTGGNLLSTAQVTMTSTDPDTFNNRALAATLVLPRISVGDVSLTKPNIGNTNVVFTLSLAAASSQTITMSYATTNGSATAGIDYQPQSGTVTFQPGVTTQTVSIIIKGNTVAGPAEHFFVNLANPVNAMLLTNQARCTILNNAGLAGQIDHFEWSPITSPQFLGEPFAVTLTAKDALNQVVSNYSGAVTLALKLGGLNFDFEKPTLPPWTTLAPASTPYELVQFDVGGVNRASQAVRFKANSSGPNGVSQTVAFNARLPYTVEADWAMVNESGIQNGVDSAQLLIAGNTITSTNLVNSRINGGDTFRGHLRGTFTPLAIGNYNLTASFTRPYLSVALWSYFDNISLTFPVSSTNYFPYNLVLTNGVWSGQLTVMQPATGVFLVPDDGNGHSGNSAVFAVLTNHPPVVNSQSFVMSEDSSQPITLTASDSDGDTLNFAIATPPTNGTVSGSVPNLTYTPNTNYWGADKFFFFVNDGKGNSVTGQVAITITAVTDLGYARLSLERTNGQLRLSLLGEPYERYGVEASQDLVHWTLVTNLIPTNGLLPFIDPNASLYTHRFYRSTLRGTSPVLSAARFLPGGLFEFDVAADVGRKFEVSASTNLADWVALTNMVMTEPTLRIVDPTAAGFSLRFYRARLLP